METTQDKASLYICRINDSAPHVRSKVFVNNQPLAALTPRTFAQMTVAPGRHSVYLMNEASFGRDMKSGVLAVDTPAGKATFVWVGVTGGGWGTLTVDHFENEKAALDCLSSARYATLPP